MEWSDTTLPVVGRPRATGWLPLVLLCACAMALVYLVQTSGVATTGYDIQRLQREKADWELRNDQLRLELAKLHSLAWVESEAVGRLGMQRPDSVTYVDAAPAASH
jgi:cell division protein FtsL